MSGSSCFRGTEHQHDLRRTRVLPYRPATTRADFGLQGRAVDMMFSIEYINESPQSCIPCAHVIGLDECGKHRHTNRNGPDIQIVDIANATN